MFKLYVGFRTEDGCRVYVYANGELNPLPLRLDVHSHSPTGFEWGYCGSGPAQLALALCLDCFGVKPRVHTLYHLVMRHILIHLPREVWALSSSTLTELCQTLWSITADDMRELMRQELRGLGEPRPEESGL
jgi:hypothetical protein